MSWTECTVDMIQTLAEAEVNIPVLCASLGHRSSKIKKPKPHFIFIDP